MPYARFLLMILMLLGCTFLTAQQQMEWHVRFSAAGEHLNQKGIYVDRTSHGAVEAYVNRDGMDYLLENEIGFQLIKKMPEKHRFLSNAKSSLNFPLSSYPSYEQYDSLMRDFAQKYSSVCRLDTIGTLSSGRQLLMLVIDDNPDSLEKEPVFLYTSTMHGDETAGYILMLNLADTLLKSYGLNPRLTALVDNVKICINPLANPDGAYAGGNHTVYYATRGNANGIDLNRNFPDPEDGMHPDGYGWQEETQLFMSLADRMNFHMSANFHGGAEVASYPWDTWNHVHPNTPWWLLISHEYADTAQFYSPPGYFSSYLFPDGITNGFDWYMVNGGRQDYMNYFHHCREMTIELSTEKLVYPSQLKPMWEYNRRSLLNYLEQVTYGVAGTVTDSISGKPLQAKVVVKDFDIDSTHAWSRSADGYYHRFFAPGNYDLSFIADGYKQKTVRVNVADYNLTTENVELVAEDVSAEANHLSGLRVFPNPVSDHIHIIFNDEPHNGFRLRLSDGTGRLVSEAEVSPVTKQYSLTVSGMDAGVYFLEISNGKDRLVKKVLIGY